jgi:predicted house-cleaning noncanonical NTP pyrophosphatase (MazG superfamily)
MADDIKISKKKPSFPVSENLNAYLSESRRNIELPILYSDLLRFQDSVIVYDDNDEDTLWIRVYYNDSDRIEIDLSLKKVYSYLVSDGGDWILKYLNVDAIDYCTFGNSKPFRIKVRNILNDNYTYFYVKKADASRIYGLEIEHMLSPYSLNFLVCEDTLIEEHIAGIPGDEFIKNSLDDRTEMEKAQIAKEFIKFNERCTITLLGDMRSYNYVIIPIHDFDQVIFKIRAIDFDQQSYEGKLKIYMPKFFKENFKMVKMVQGKIQEESIEQYKIEVRSIVAKRIISYRNRLNALLKCMKSDQISNKKNVNNLKEEIYNYSHDKNFRKCASMGEIVRVILDFVKRNYENVSTSKL